jgi:hypothetical protein
MKLKKKTNYGVQSIFQLFIKSNQSTRYNQFVRQPDKLNIDWRGYWVLIYKNISVCLSLCPY